MSLQSIKRIAIEGVDLSLYPGRYEEIWPDIHLKTASVTIAGSVRVAVVDSGIPAGYPGGDGTNRDDDGHALHVIATILGRKPLPGLEIDIRAIKAFSAQGWPTPERTAPAIREAAGTGAHVIVLPWDVGHGTAELEQAIADIQNAVVVIAAGNWSLDNDRYPNWPAVYGTMGHVITVMATNACDERASYSSYGKGSVYVGAPGYAVVDVPHFPSTLRTAGSLRDCHIAFRGTSAAAAHVARLAALVRAKYPTLTPDAVKHLIGEAARPVRGLGKPTGVKRPQYSKKPAIADFHWILS
jgi:subtilisin family serine protease